MIWKRYFYKEIIKTYCLFLFGFFALYVAIDVMTHLKDLRAGNTSLSVWVTYYLCTFSRRLDVLVPFTVLLGTIRILLSLQMRNELVALLVSGLPMRVLFRPFIVAACAASLLLYVNFQYLLPKAQPKALAIQENDFGKTKAAAEEPAIREVLLKDASRMFYSDYNPIVRQFSDVFWIVSMDRVYHMQTLNCMEEHPVGRNVDLIVRDDTGKMVKQSSTTIETFTTMQFDEESLQNSVQLPKDQSISTLISQTELYGKSMSDRAIDVRSFLIYKLTFPLICLLAAIAPAFYCLSFRRDMPQFMIYLVSLGALFCFFLLLQVAFVLAKSHVVSPLMALGLPWLIVGVIVTRNYMRTIYANA